MTNLERLLRGDKATYCGCKIIGVTDYSTHPDVNDDIPIDIITLRTNKNIGSIWLSRKKVNRNTNIIFTSSDKPRVIEDGLREGDIIINGLNKRKVLGICGEIIIPSIPNIFDRSGGTYTLKEIINLNYKLIQPEPTTQTVKMTVAEVSKLVGKTVEITE